MYGVILSYFYESVYIQPIYPCPQQCKSALYYQFRLPIVQGSSFSYVIPSLALMSLPQFQCPPGFNKSKLHSISHVSFPF